MYVHVHVESISILGQTQKQEKAVGTSFHIKMNKEQLELLHSEACFWSPDWCNSIRNAQNAPL